MTSLVCRIQLYIAEINVGEYKNCIDKSRQKADNSSNWLTGGSLSHTSLSAHNLHKAHQYIWTGVHKQTYRMKLPLGKLVNSTFWSVARLVYCRLRKYCCVNRANSSKSRIASFASSPECDDADLYTDQTTRHAQTKCLCSFISPVNVKSAAF